jgi:hypothetical protein
MRKSGDPLPNLHPGVQLPADSIDCDRATVHPFEACLRGFEGSPSPNGEQLYLTARSARHSLLPGLLTPIEAHQGRRHLSGHFRATAAPRRLRKRHVSMGTASEVRSPRATQAAWRSAKAILSHSRRRYPTCKKSKASGGFPPRGAPISELYAYAFGEGRRGLGWSDPIVSSRTCSLWPSVHTDQGGQVEQSAAGA